MIDKSNWKRDAFDFKCWRCEKWVNISDAIFIPFFGERLLGWFLRYPVRYMCYDCIDELAMYNRAESVEKYGIYCPNQYCPKTYKVFKTAHDVFQHARAYRNNGRPECMEALNARLAE